METWRNFFLGSEIRKAIPVLRPLDIQAMRSDHVRASWRSSGSTSAASISRSERCPGGQRQCVAIARAVYFGAKVLILDEPTAALGVKQSGIVLKYVAKARDVGRRPWCSSPTTRITLT